MALKRKNSFPTEQAVKRSRPLDNETGAQSTPLLQLPVELIREIAECLESDQLLRLRRVCKTLNDAVLPFLGEAYFRDLSILVSDRRAMDVLHDISRHKDFARYVRNIHLGALEIIPLEDLEKRWPPQVVDELDNPL